MYSSELIKGTLKTIIMNLLKKQGKMYGYEITQHVKDKTAGEIGVIDYIDKSSAQELVYIIKDDEELIFPLIDEFIQEINLSEKIMKTDLPEGLLDINKDSE